jgi:hypothetical protein
MSDYLLLPTRTLVQARAATKDPRHIEIFDEMIGHLQPMCVFTGGCRDSCRVSCGGAVSRPDLVVQSEPV